MSQAVPEFSQSIDSPVRLNDGQNKISVLDDRDAQLGVVGANANVEMLHGFVVHALRVDAATLIARDVARDEQASASRR